MSRSQLVVGILAGLTCATLAIYAAIRPKADTSPRDLSGLERAAAAGEIQSFTDMGELSVWANDFHRIEPALHAAAGDREIRLMMGGTCVGVYTRRSGIQVRETP